MIEKQVTADSIGVLEDGRVLVRTVTRILEDGKEIMHSYERKVLEPGDDVVQEHPRVRAITAAIWTPDIAAEYARKKAERESVP